jgi:hypothetical protein
MQEIDYHEFVFAMVNEVNDHKKRGHWTIMQCCDMPPNSKTIMSIWIFKQKQYPDGMLNKHKARLCAHRRMQTWGQNYWETLLKQVFVLSLPLYRSMVFSQRA